VSRILLVTHPEVDQDPTTPVTDWALTRAGRDRMARFAGSDAVRDVRAVWCSRERKAVEAAEILASRLGVRPKALEQLGEHDRSSTGYLPPELFEPAVRAFFAEPLLSHRGWETAAAAQERILDAVETVIARSPAGGDVAVVAHGGVGTLLLCHLQHIPIDRAADQPGQGHWFAFDRDTRRLLHGWRPLG
jgi:broad specificity phosphatase PhoE